HASACRRVRAVLVGWTPDLFDAADRRVLTRRAVQRELDTVLAGLASDLRRRVSALRVCSPAPRQAAGTVRTAVPGRAGFPGALAARRPSDAGLPGTFGAGRFGASVHRDAHHRGGEKAGYADRSGAQ